MSDNGRDPLEAVVHALQAGTNPRAIINRHLPEIIAAGKVREVDTLLDGLKGPWGRLALWEAIVTTLHEKGTVELVHAARQACPETEPWDGRRAVSLSELFSHPDYCRPPEFDWKPYTARSRATLLSVGPKAGKTTLAAHYATARARGAEWLGQKLERGAVLWVGPDEHLQDVTLRFKSLEAPAEQIAIWVAPGPDAGAIAEEAQAFNADLIVLDTLTKIARIKDENDNAAWTLWFNEALPVIRDSDADWLMIHHDRKSGGEHGEGIRGASAIFASVDIALSLRRVKDHARRRLLRIEGSRYEVVDDVVIELREDGEYVRLGDPRTLKAEEDAALQRVRNALTTTPQTVAQIEELVALQSPVGETPARSTIRRYLDRLLDLEWTVRSGQGGHRDPYRYAEAREDQ